MPENWTANLYFSNNHTAIFPDTPIFLEGGEMAHVFESGAPSIYQAQEDQLAEIVVTAISMKDPAIRSERLTLTLMDVVHGIDLDTSHRMADVEQDKLQFSRLRLPIPVTCTIHLHSMTRIASKATGMAVTIRLAGSLPNAGCFGPGTVCNQELGDISTYQPRPRNVCRLRERLV